MDTVKLIIRESQTGNGKTAHLILNNQKNFNAINKRFIDGISESLRAIQDMGDIGAVIISSDVAKAFSSGVDIKYVQSLTNKEAEKFFVEISILLEKLANFPLPTIALINGYAFGAGADLALACDLRLASETAVFRFPGPQFGLILGTQRLIHEIGPAKARYLTLLNKKIDCQLAQNYGLVHEVYRDLTEAQEKVTELLKTLEQVPEQTLLTLKKLTSAQHVSHEYTAHSVRIGDFQERFQRYISKSFS